MPASPPDRALRREIARLALLDPIDLEAILDDLDEPQRRRVETLLRDLAAPPREGIASRAPDGSLSAWIEARMVERHDITPRARSVLTDCARRYTARERKPTRSATTASLFERTLAVLTSGRLT